MKNGFTIIELIISIFILSVAIVGIFSAFSVIKILTYDTADRLTATYLAQEGMEIVRNIRDTNWLNMDFCAATPSDSRCTPNLPAWVDGLGSCTNGCEADYRTGTGQQDSSSVMTQWTSSGRYLKINLPPNGSGFYNYTSGAQTKFKRKITIASITDVDGLTDHIIKVTVQVSWDKKATILSSKVSAGTCNATASNCITAEGTLYDWYK